MIPTLSLRLVDRHGPREDQRHLRTRHLDLAVGKLGLERVGLDQHVAETTSGDREPDDGEGLGVVRLGLELFTQFLTLLPLLFALVLVLVPVDAFGTPLALGVDRVLELVREADNAAHTSVHERLVDILDEHDLGVDLDAEVGGRHEVGESLLASRPVLERATIGSRVRVAVGAQRVETLVVGTLHVLAPGEELGRLNVALEEDRTVEAPEPVDRLWRKRTEAHLVEHVDKGWQC